MIRSLFAITAGYFCMLFLNSFIRVIIAVYTRSPISLSGTSALPSPATAYLVLAGAFLFGVIGGLLTCTISGKKPEIEILCLILLLVTAGLFTYNFSAGSEPVWFLLGSPLLKISGTVTGYYLKAVKPESY